MTKSESRMQFCEDIEKVIKEYTRPYRDPKSHKNHKRVMSQIKRISHAWRRLLRSKRVSKRYLPVYVENHYGLTGHKTSTHRLPPPFVKRVQHCFSKGNG